LLTALSNGSFQRLVRTGFLSGVGGIVTLPVAVPAALFASWLIAARLALCIAHLHGFDVFAPEVCSFPRGLRRGPCLSGGSC
jgi:hypothetical protein